MSAIVGVSLSPGGKVMPFDSDGLDLHWNDRVVCQTSRGLELGRVVQATRPADQGGPPPRKVVRRASARDEETARRHADEAATAMRAIRAVLREHGVNVKPLAADIPFDGRRVIFTYRAEEGTDLRSLAGPLAERAGRRVELRHVSPREGARTCGGGGMCGERLCCTRFPSHEQPITLRMAKDQELPMNPGRITGLCGRLRCCLAFEHPVYRSFRDRAPAVGRTVETPLGTGVVRAYKVPEDALVVRLAGAEHEVDVKLDEATEVGAGA